jgi:hypothetical protein
MAAPNDDPTLFVDLLFGVMLSAVVAYFSWKRWKCKASERWPLAAAA